MGSYAQLSLEQMEIVHKIYINIGTQPFRHVDHQDLFDKSYILGLKRKGVIRQYGKRQGYNHGNYWILTETGIRNALRYRKT